MEDRGEVLTGKARFDHFVVPEIEVMLRVARSLTASAAEAEDLVQDALLRAYRSIDSFDGRHPRAWLLTIVRNTNINRNRRQRPVLVDDPDAPEVEGRTPTAASTEDTYLEGTFDAAVTASLAALTPDARRVVELVDLAGLSYAEAAEVLDVPVGTVMSRLHRAGGGCATICGTAAWLRGGSDDAPRDAPAPQGGDQLRPGARSRPVLSRR